VDDLHVCYLVMIHIGGIPLPLYLVCADIRGICMYRRGNPRRYASGRTAGGCVRAVLCDSGVTL
jgi:hypothetical protein